MMPPGFMAEASASALAAVPGVASAVVNLATGRATVHGDDVDWQAVVRAVDKAGYDVPAPEPLELRIDGILHNAEFARAMLADPDVRAGKVHTKWIEEVFLDRYLRARV